MDANLSAARQHISLAREALDAARLLRDSALTRSSIDRAYYAAFHAASALLAAVGVYPGTHDGVIAMLSLHFVKPGALPGTTGKDLQHLYNQRLIADYKGYLDQDISEAQACVQTAEAILASCLARLPEATV
jgi:hypothetical protein